MDLIITKTIEDFKKAIKIAKTIGATWIEAGSHENEYWNVYKNKTVLIVDSPFLFFTSKEKLIEEYNTISLKEFEKICKTIQSTKQ